MDNKSSGGRWILIILAIAIAVFGFVMAYQGGYSIGYGCTM